MWKYVVVCGAFLCAYAIGTRNNDSESLKNSSFENVPHQTIYTNMTHDPVVAQNMHSSSTHGGALDPADNQTSMF